MIRGFALSGVFLANVYVWMSGMIFMPRAEVQAALSGTLAKVLDGLAMVLVAGKFMTMFTFLFGLGLSVQFARAAERHDSAVKRYARRCFALFALGMLHMMFLWHGDITHQYALIGLFVLLFRNRSTKTLVIWGLALTLLAVPVGMWIEFVLPKVLQSGDAAKAAMEAEMAKGEETGRQALEVYRGSAYLAIVRMNLITYWHHVFDPIMAAYDVAVLGNFLLGLAVGRAQWFQDVPGHRRAFKRLLGWGLLTTILTFATIVVMRKITGTQNMRQESVWMGMVIPILRNASTLAHAVVYMSAIALLYQRDFFRKVLSMFAPVGRMAVTNYFMQSAIGLFVFTGIGLGRIGDLRARWIVVMPFVMFTLQMILSWIWLRHFRFGPVEWISRSITYGKMQSMRISTADSVPPR